MPFDGRLLRPSHIVCQVAATFCCNTGVSGGRLQLGEFEPRGAFASRSKKKARLSSRPLQQETSRPPHLASPPGGGEEHEWKSMLRPSVLEDLRRQRVLQAALDHPLQRPGTVDRVVAAVGQQTRAAEAESVPDAYRPDATGALAGCNFVFTVSSAILPPMSWPTTVEKR